MKGITYLFLAFVLLLPSITYYGCTMMSSRKTPHGEEHSVFKVGDRPPPSLRGMKEFREEPIMVPPKPAPLPVPTVKPKRPRPDFSESQPAVPKMNMATAVNKIVNRAAAIYDSAHIAVQELPSSTSVLVQREMDSIASNAKAIAVAVKRFGSISQEEKRQAVETAVKEAKKEAPQKPQDPPKKAEKKETTVATKLFWVGVGAAVMLVLTAAIIYLSILLRRPDNPPDPPEVVDVSQEQPPIDFYTGADNSEDPYFSKG